METTWQLVLFGATITALATGLGALPLLAKSWRPRTVNGQVILPSGKIVGIGHIIAAGLMLVASASLVIEGYHVHPTRMLIGAAVGAVAILLASRLMHRYETQYGLEFAALQGRDARRALLVIAVMTAHSFAEGIGVGVSFAGETSFGLFVTTLIAVHNIPEGLAIALLLVPKGVSVTKAALWSIFSSLPQPLVAVPAFMFVMLFEPLLAAGLGFAAGAMIWMACTEMVPEAVEEIGVKRASSYGAVTVIGAGLLLMASTSMLS